MAQIDRIQVKSTTYDVAQSANATFAGTSGDASSATSWTDVAVLASGETNGSIFTKISKMFKNIRYLYGKLGTTDFSGTGQSTVTAALANLGTNHKHTTAQLPVSSQQVNSNAYIPTSDLIYSMNTTLTSLNDAIRDNPNNRFEELSLGTWSSLSQVNTFFNTYKHDNNYKGLALGNYVRIQDGTYNVDWMIAGFDTEYNRGDTASGWGITFIPRNYVTTASMNSSNTTAGGYKGSVMHTTTLPTIATKLQNVLGTHLNSRRILVTNSVDTTKVSPACASWTGVSNGWEWVSAYCSLMSEVQVYGSTVFGGGFDTGEACQKLPVFNFINHNQYARYNFWLRGVASSTFFALAYSSGYAGYANAGIVIGVRPLIYLS